MNEEFTAANEQMLRGQVIDENGPGTILSDFVALLDYIAAHQVPLTKIHNLFSMNILPELNALLARPPEVRLKRPKQKSFPHVNGLYMLLRMSGLTRVVTKSKHCVLEIDEQAYASWRGLNPAERYFSLLEAWLVRGTEEIMGEHDPHGSIYQASDFMKHLGAPGLRVGRRLDLDPDSLSYRPGLHNLALLEMFGCLNITLSKTPPGEGWKIRRLDPLPWGTALFAVIHQVYRDNRFLFFDYADSGPLDDSRFDTLQQFLQPYFPGWENVLTLGKHEFADGLYTFKVTLPYHKAWRRIAIPGKWVLEDLSDAILDAFDFDNDHLHQFTYRSRSGREIRVTHEAIDYEPRHTDEIRIGDAPLAPGEKMTYLFDFGDNWEFEVMLEEIAPPDPKAKKARIIEKHGQAPPQYWSEDENDEDWEEDDE